MKKLTFRRKKQITTPAAPPAGQPTSTTEPVKAVMIERIDEINAKPFFIDCCIKRDYSAIGTGTPQELEDRYYLLLSSYYEVSKNETVKREVALYRRMLGIHMDRIRINTNAELLGGGFFQSSVDVLKGYYPGREITADTPADEKEQYIKWVLTGDIGRKIELEKCEAELSKISTPASETKQEQAIEALYSKVADFNSIEGGTSYKLAELSVMEFAILEARLKAHIERLDNQRNKAMSNR